VQNHQDTKDDLAVTEQDGATEMTAEERRAKQERVIADPSEQPRPGLEARELPLDATIEKLVYGGEGLARVSGRVVLVPFVLPGEQVRITEAQVRKDVLRATGTQIMEPSPQRITPGCPYFANCGGCDYQQASYEHQLALKQSILREVFERVGKLRPPESIEVIASEPWGYRNRSQFRVDGFRIGYLGAGSHRVVNVDHCPISSPKLNEALTAIKGMRKSKRFPYFLRSFELFTNERVTQLNVLETERPIAKAFFEWAAREIPGLVSGPLVYSAAGHDFRVSHKSFFQVNRFLVDALVQAAIGDLEGETAIDLYSGVGLFTLPLAKRFSSVTAVESSASAIEDLAINAAEAKLRVKAVKNSVDAYLAGLEQSADLVLADPPRAGLGKAAVRHLVRLKPKRIVIVSCDPATLARDLGPLLESGYHWESATLCDLFPQTYHMETVVHLRHQSA
jgi:23S rRNA (uracil1939-C5)-methyltransferase